MNKKEDAKRAIIFVFLLAAAAKTPALSAAQEYLAISSPAAERLVPRFSAIDERISLDLRDIELKDVFKYLGEKAQINIVPTNQVSGRVTIMIKEAPVDDIFEILIRSNGLAYEKVGAIYNVMTEKEYKERYGRAFDDIRQVKVFHLQYVIPDQAYLAADSLKSSIGKVLVEADSGTIMVLDTPEKINEIEQALAALERKSTIRIFTLRYAKAEDVAKQLKTQLDLKNVGSVKEDPRTNQVIVQTLPERMHDIEKIILGLDRKTKGVLIDARVIQVKLSDSLSAGVQWEGLFNLSQKGGLTYLGSYPFSSVAGATDDWRSRAQVYKDLGNVGSYPFSGTTSDFGSGTKKTALERMHVGVVGRHDYDVLIKYLKELGSVRILSNPKLAVTNNQEAKIHVGERQAYITTTTTAGQTTTTIAEQVTFLDVGLQLYIMPTINDEGYVTLKIKPEISSVVGTLITAQQNRIPILDTSTAETTVMVKDGHSVIIGGLRREENTAESRHMPVFSKIPLLGMLFKDEAKREARNELLIMVTAHILSGDDLTTGYARDIHDKMDKEYQQYDSILTESDLEAQEREEGKAREKIYREYPEFPFVEEFRPELKPLKDE